MGLKIMAVYDSKSESYGALFTTKTVAEAKRGFGEAANDSKGKLGKWPEDHTLFELGEYEETTGEITVLKAQVNHGLAIHYVDRSIPLKNSEQA